MSLINYFIQKSRAVILSQILSSRYPKTTFNYLQNKYIYAGQQADLYQKLERIIGNYADEETGLPNGLVKMFNTPSAGIRLEELKKYIDDLTAIQDKFTKRFQGKTHRSLGQAISYLSVAYHIKYYSAKKSEVETTLDCYAQMGISITTDFGPETLLEWAKSSPTIAFKLIESQWPNLTVPEIVGFVKYYLNKAEVDMDGKSISGQFIVRQMVDILFKQTPELCAKLSESPENLELCAAIPRLHKFLQDTSSLTINKENCVPEKDRSVKDSLVQISALKI